jgi:hypothetical protein
VRNNQEYSAFFRCDIGVRQGENLSPFLFALYLNDLEKFFIQNDINSLEKVERAWLRHITFIFINW